MARAKSRAAKGSRSSIPSPTPMKWTGKREFLGDGDQDAAAGGAVELGHHQARDARHLGEDLDLAQGVLAHRGVEHEQHGMGRTGFRLLDDPHHFGEFVHQLGPVLQAARRIDQHDVGSVLARLLDGVEGETRRVGALRPRDDR